MMLCGYLIFTLYKDEPMRIINNPRPIFIAVLLLVALCLVIQVPLGVQIFLGQLHLKQVNAHKDLLHNNCR